MSDEGSSTPPTPLSVHPIPLTALAARSLFCNFAPCDILRHPLETHVFSFPPAPTQNNPIPVDRAILPLEIHNMAKTTTLKEFESVFPKLVEDLLDHAKTYKLPEEFVAWYKAVRTSPLFLVLELTASSLSMPIPSAENAIAECLSPTPSPCSSKPPSPRNNTLKPRL